MQVCQRHKLKQLPYLILIGHCLKLMIVYLLFCICISLLLQPGQALFLLVSPRKAFGQMEVGQLETTELKTLIIYYTQGKFIKAKTNPSPSHEYNSAHPSSPARQASHRKMENFPGWGQIWLGSREPESN